MCIKTETSSCLFPIQLKWGGWTDDEISFILKFCDSFCITARWSQDCFKVFLSRSLMLSKVSSLEWLFQIDITFLIRLPWSKFTWKCVCVSWALLRGLACLQWFIIFSYQHQCQVSRCSLKVICLCENFQHGLETMAFLNNYIISHKRHPLWKGASCSVFVKILISLQFFFPHPA